jgi:hypothetical protein
MISDWNNSVTTTRQDVLDVMEKAAISLEEVSK